MEPQQQQGSIDSLWDLDIASSSIDSLWDLDIASSSK